LARVNTNKTTPLPQPPNPGALVARAHSDDDDGPLPLLRLPRQEVDLKRMRKLRPTPSLGGATIGEELSLIYRQHQAADRRAAEMQVGLHSGNWAGDEYIGGRWNVLSVRGSSAAGAGGGFVWTLS
jgi:hypothetical protein